MSKLSAQKSAAPSPKQQMETRFVELMAELFQLDEAEALDFGLYRVIRRHNREVRAFLGEIVADGAAKALQGGRLAELLDAAFASVGHEAQAEDKFRVKELEKQLGLKPGMTQAQREAVLAQAEGIPAASGIVTEYRSRTETLGLQQTVQQDRAEVLNRLYQFFSRHYQDGDFIVERRYGKGGARYVKSTGEDTEFHWATEDMYYIKSGDIFTDFPVRLGNGQRVVFGVSAESLQATRAALKPNDKAHYELEKAAPDGNVLRVSLAYLKGAQTEKQKDEIVAAVQKAGGGDAADIRRWFNRYAARNQSDFFIHKRLREALSEDLDIFIKTEVLDTEQLLAGGDLPQRVMKVARIVRDVGGHIVAFLAALEDFQKALWEKKKLVFETRYVITLDRLERYAPAWLAHNIDTIVAGQRQEWQELGLGDYSDAAACIRRTVGDLATPATAQYLPLPVDTRNFDAAFKWSLLEAVTAATALDEALDGVAIQSDNWQALNSMHRTLQDRVKCIYIDPPYNTGGDGFPYKDAYQRASWAAMIDNRLEKSAALLSRNGAIFASIDHIERDSLCRMLRRCFGEKNRVEEIIWSQTIGSKNQSPTYSTNHEYVEVFARDISTASSDERMFREPKPGASDLLELAEKINPEFPSIAEIQAQIKLLFDQHKSEFKIELEEQGIEYEKSLDPWRGLYNYCNAEYRDAEGRYIPASMSKEKSGKIWIWRTDPASMPQGKQADSTANPNDPNYRFYQPIHPVTKGKCKRPSRGWAFPLKPDPSMPDRTSFEVLDGDCRIAWGDNETKMPEQKKFLHEIDTQVGKSVVVDNSSGEKELTNITGSSRSFPNPKPTTLIERFILQTTEKDDLVLDFFAGSGTTFHAALSAFHDDRKRRKVILVEAGKHFDMVLVPRAKRVSAAWQWTKGKPSSINGCGCFLKLQRFEQYEDVLENLDTEIGEGDSGELLFQDAAFALRYRLDKTSRALYSGVERFASPFSYRLKRAEGGGAAPDCEVDLVESLPYLLGMDVVRLYREDLGVVMLGRNRRGQSVAVFFRDCVAADSAQWVAGKLSQHPADRVYTNDPAGLSFAGCDSLEAIESVFALQFGRS